MSFISENNQQLFKKIEKSLKTLQFKRRLNGNLEKYKMDKEFI